MSDLQPDKNTSVFVEGVFSRKERKDRKAGGPTSVSATIDRSGWKRVRLGEALTNVGWCNYSHLQPRQVRKVTQGDDTGEVSITTDYYHPASPVVLFGDHTCNVKYVDFDCLILGDGVKLLTPNHEVFSTRFLYYLVQYVASKVPQGYARHLAVLKETECALPCYEDQFKIANAITSIDTHISALQALIAKYEAIKKATVNLLLKPKTWWQEKPLGDLAFIKTGGKNTQDAVSSGRYPFFVRSPNVERIDTYSYDGEAVLVAGDGVGAGKVFHYINGKHDCHQRVYRVKDFSPKVLGRYIYRVLSEQFPVYMERRNDKASILC